MQINLEGDAAKIIGFYANLLDCTPSQAVAWLAGNQKVRDAARIAEASCSRCSELPVQPSELTRAASTGVEAHK
jgi:hypothetical protein